MRYFLGLTLVSLSLLVSSCSPAPAAAPKNPQTQAIAGTAGIVDSYRTWVEAQTDQLVAKTKEFTAAVMAGDRATAQALYAPTRMFYENIEPIAEALGDLDSRIDAREGKASAEQWRGFHKLEKLLWSTDNLRAGKTLAQGLLEDIHLLRAKVETAEISLSAMVTGAVELLNEVSTTKLTGEEERYSHTDLWDFQANVQGAFKIYELLRPALEMLDLGLAEILKERLAVLTGLLDSHKKGDGYQLYGELKPADVKALSAAVDGVAEPLSQLGKLFPVEPVAQ